jgi:hypothetical protein
LMMKNLSIYDIVHCCCYLFVMLTVYGNLQPP